MAQKRSQISINLTQQSQLSNNSLVRDFSGGADRIVTAKGDSLDDDFQINQIKASEYGRHVSIFLLMTVLETGALHDYLICQQLITVQYAALAMFVLFILVSALLIIDLTHTQNKQPNTQNAFQKAIDIRFIEGVYQKRCEMQRKNTQLQIYLPRNLLKIEINCTYTLFLGFLWLYLGYIVSLHLYLCVQAGGAVLAVIISGTVVCCVAFFLALSLFVCMVCKQRNYQRTRILPRINRKERPPEIRITCQKSTNLSCFKTMKNTNKKVEINDQHNHYFAYDKDVPANRSFDKGNLTARSNDNKVNYTSILTCNQHISGFKVGTQQIEPTSKSKSSFQQQRGANQGHKKHKLNCDH